LLLPPPPPTTKHLPHSLLHPLSLSLSLCHSLFDVSLFALVVTPFFCLSPVYSCTRSFSTHPFWATPTKIHNNKILYKNNRKHTHKIAIYFIAEQFRIIYTSCICLVKCIKMLASRTRANLFEIK